MPRNQCKEMDQKWSKSKSQDNVLARTQRTLPGQNMHFLSPKKQPLSVSRLDIFCFQNMHFYPQTSYRHIPTHLDEKNIKAKHQNIKLSL